VLLSGKFQFYYVAAGKDSNNNIISTLTLLTLYRPVLLSGNFQY